MAVVGLAFAIGTAIPGTASAAREHDWVGVEKCRTCHGKELMGNQVATWQAGPHRRAYETLSSPESLAIAEALGLIQAPAETDACLDCHLSAHAVPPVRIAHPLERADGVQCESCHGPGRDYRKKKIMSKRKTAERKGLFDPARDAAICTACHNENSPTFAPSRYELADGSASGFDFELAKRRILHEIPADVKGNFIELEEKQKAAEKAKAATR
jgi:hypothetical protein